jgi:hypothetical protein
MAGFKAPASDRVRPAPSAGGGGGFRAPAQDLEREESPPNRGVQQADAFWRQNTPIARTAPSRDVPMARARTAPRAPEASLGDYAFAASPLAIVEQVQTILGDTGARQRQQERGARISNSVRGVNREEGVGEFLLTAPPKTEGGVGEWVADEARSWKTALGFFLDGNEEHRAEIVKAQYPDAEFARDRFNALMVRMAPGEPWSYLNPNGLDVTDATNVASTVLRHLPGARVASAPKTFVARALTGGAAAGATEAASQEAARIVGGPGASAEDVGMAATGGFGGQLAGDIVVAGAQAAPQAVRRIMGGPNAARNPAPAPLRDPDTPASAANAYDDAMGATEAEEAARLEARLRELRGQQPLTDYVPQSPLDEIPLGNAPPAPNPNAQTVRASPPPGPRPLTREDVGGDPANTAQRVYDDMIARERQQAATNTPLMQRQQQGVTLKTPEEITAMVSSAPPPVLAQFTYRVDIARKSIADLEARTTLSELDAQKLAAARTDLANSEAILAEAQKQGKLPGAGGAAGGFDFATQGQPRPTGNAGLGQDAPPRPTPSGAEPQPVAGRYSQDVIRERARTTSVEDLHAMEDALPDLEDTVRSLEANPNRSVFEENELALAKRDIAESEAILNEASRMGRIANARAQAIDDEIAYLEERLRGLREGTTRYADDGFDGPGAMADEYAAAPQGAARPTPSQVRAAGDEFEIQTTRGEAAQDVRLRQKEDELRQQGNDTLRGFDDRRAAAIQRTGDAIATRGQQRISENLDDAGVALQARVINRLGKLDDMADAAYSRAFETLSNLQVQKTEGALLRTMTEKRLRFGSGDLTDPNLTPTGYRGENPQHFKVQTTAQNIIGDTADLIEEGGVNFVVIERARQRLRAMQESADASADPLGADALRNLRHGFDEWLDQALARAMLGPKGKRPATGTAAQANNRQRAEARVYIERARQIWSEREELFTQSRPGDRGGKALELAREADRSGTQVINVIMGAGPTPPAQAVAAVKAIRRLGLETNSSGRLASDSTKARNWRDFQSATGRVPEELQILREALWHRILEPLRHRTSGDFVPIQSVISNLHTALNGAGRGVTAEMFTKAELATMQRLLSYLRYIKRPIGVSTGGSVGAALRQQMGNALDQAVRGVLGAGSWAVQAPLAVARGRALELGDEMAAAAAVRRPMFDIEPKGHPGAALAQTARPENKAEGTVRAEEMAFGPAPTSGVGATDGLGEITLASDDVVTVERAGRFYNIPLGPEGVSASVARWRNGEAQALGDFPTEEAAHGAVQRRTGAR